MRSRSTFNALMALSAAVMLAGSASACTATVRPRQGVVYVREGPPPRIREIRGVAPSRNHVWIAGHYEYRGRAYVWVPGRYELPTGNYHRWQPGSWKHDRNGWYWVEGHWR